MKPTDLTVPVPVGPVLGEEMVTSSLDHHAPPLLTNLSLISLLTLHSSTTEGMTRMGNI